MRTLSVVPFQSDSGNDYVYDDNTGSLFVAEAPLLDVLRLHADLPLDEVVVRLAGRFPENDTREAVSLVSHWETTYGAFYRSEEDLAKVQGRWDAAAYSAFLQNTGFRQLILSVTEDCNLRCRYCYFSDTYADSRPRTHKMMPFDVGRKAVDYFLSQSALRLDRNPTHQVAIGFYGGEPLLNWKLIRGVVEHVEPSVNSPDCLRGDNKRNVAHRRHG